MFHPFSVVFDGFYVGFCMFLELSGGFSTRKSAGLNRKDLRGVEPGAATRSEEEATRRDNLRASVGHRF